jgi:hypothetical protein
MMLVYCGSRVVLVYQLGRPLSMICPHSRTAANIFLNVFSKPKLLDVFTKSP